MEKIKEVYDKLDDKSKDLMLLLAKTIEITQENNKKVS